MFLDFFQDMGGQYQAAFGAKDVSGPAMGRAIAKWYALYFDRTARDGYDPCLQIPYTIVRRLVSAVFSEMRCESGCLQNLDHREALAHALIGGECYLKPVVERGQWHVVPRWNLLVFGRDHRGEPTDVGLSQKIRKNRHYFTLLERRTLENGTLTVTNRLFRSGSLSELGREVGLSGPFQGLPAKYVYPGVWDSVGLVRVKTPITNCVDGSREGVSVYAPAVGLLEAIGENEAQLRGEFRRGQSRLVVSRDMLRGGKFDDDLFVGLDEDPERVGITIFSPQLREQSYLNRQQAYLRGVENLVGLKRGLLSQVEAADRTATEITSSEGEYRVTICDLQKVWQEAAEKAARLWGQLSGEKQEKPVIQWGDGVL